MNPFFSVVITVYNKAEFIQNTLNAVLKQSFQDFEIIIVNDGSTDNSEAIIKTFNDKRIQLISTKNQGVSVARNTGINGANCKYIALLDGDDFWEVDYLKQMHSAISKFPEYKIFAAGVAQKYKHGTVPVNYSFKPTQKYEVYNYFKASQKYSLLTSSSVVFDKSVLHKTNLYDTSLVSGEDIDMWIRFGLHYDIVFVNEQLVSYVFSPSSLSNTALNLDKKPKFDKYFDEEKKDKYLKIFLDRNRYSLAILSKLRNDKERFSYYKTHLDIGNINFRQRILLKLPRWLLVLLIKLKSLNGEKTYYPLD